jgi:hypothetical protein
MLGCGGSDVSTADAFLDFATDDGRVSGSKSAFRTRASFAERDGGRGAVVILALYALRQWYRPVQDISGYW